MATRPGKTASGKRDGGKSTSPSNASKNRQNVGRIQPAARDSKVGARAGSGSAPQHPPRDRSRDPTQETPEPEWENGPTRPVVRRTGPRRVLIFAESFAQAREIAERKKYPRELWRFVTSEADVYDVDPREWATITVPGFQKKMPQAWSAYQDIQAKCRGYGVRMPSYDP